MSLSTRAYSGSASGVEATDGMWMVVGDMKITTSLPTKITDCSLSLVNRGNKNKGLGTQGTNRWHVWRDTVGAMQAMQTSARPN